MEKVKSYQQLFAEQCTSIVQQVLEDMEKNRFHVGTKPIPVPKSPILYRWWFPSDSPIVAYLKDYITKHPEDIDMKYMYSRLKKKEIGYTIYYALYFGKSTNGRKRFGQHIRGPIKQSTLRETLRAVLSLKGEICTEERISDELQKCYYEWMEFCEDDRELIDCFEMMAIAIGYYPLNMEGNTSISEEWKKSIVDRRKELKDYK